MTTDDHPHRSVGMPSGKYTRLAVAAMRQSRRGAIMPIGGAEERSPQGVILRTFVDLAGQESARIVILPTASSDPTAGEDYAEIFHRIGARSVEIARIESREDANDERQVTRFGEATGIFITGGDQARLSKLVVGALVAETIQQRSLEGATIAGTSAGASILGAHMMSDGESEASPHKGMVEIVTGFGVLDDIIIDQHFSTRGRIGRLLVTFAANPGLIAFGIDENTALVIQHDGIAQAIGKGSVTVVDGRGVYSDYHDLDEGEILSIIGSQIHVLAPGRFFDLERRTVLHLVQEQTFTSRAAG
jgi:cyanophycinase